MHFLFLAAETETYQKDLLLKGEEIGIILWLPDDGNNKAEILK